MANITEQEIFIECITKQLEEVDLLSSIYCSPGEMKILDPSVISDFNDFLKNPRESIMALRSNLDYIINVAVVLDNNKEEKVEIRIELPHLYPKLENAIVIVHSTLLSKTKEKYLKVKVEKFIDQQEKNDTYIYQVITWIQEEMSSLIKEDPRDLTIDDSTKIEEQVVDFERLWIYSHHIKSKTKRQEIVKQARIYNLSGFSRPGKPGIICVEGLCENTQEFWRIIKSMRWQKINICKEERSRKAINKIDEMRRFDGFKEQLFCDDTENEDAVMNMGLFVKFLEMHNSGYMKKELFGI
ncbi:RWD domain-containing protein 2A [Teleopsis dalmanni]|uniref:RWD domain-containing protein 2A n=1 Tax=Teleopsis dalmanni TaxID=139649 RepID=UPI0018CFEE21|nr:RWD domain-containing protein 2A [Teleopsis dalmanni]XP_037948897.1 RWD domain-containing protein 2A [Teleopsis dalmanni]